MGLQIQFIDRQGGERRQVAAPSSPGGQKRFELREDKGDWIAPEVNLVPVKDLPVISRVDFQVVGAPDVVVSRLQSAYPGRQFARPVQLAQPRQVATGRAPNANPLPQQVLCELRVTAVYQNADARGAPTGPALTISDVCLLYTGAAPDHPPEIVVRNRELSVLVGQRTIQTIEVRQGRGAVPALGLAYPDTVVARDDPILERIRPALGPLKKAIEDALAASPARSEVGPMVQEYAFPVHVRLGQAEKTALNDLDREVIVPCVAVVEGVRPVTWLLKLEVASRVFRGWVVIDFGTTNSTVTVHDTQNIVPFLGLPEEQEHHLRESLINWLKLEVAEALPPHGRKYESDWKRLRTQTAGTLNIIEDLPAWLAAETGQGLYALIAQFEGNLRLYPEPFRRAFSVQLGAMVSEALRIPTLRRFQLFPMKIDLDQKQEVVASDLEITGVEEHGSADDRWPVIRMGKQAAKGRLAAIGRDDGVPLEHVLQRFHPSPKRYFGTDREPFVVQLDRRSEVVTYDQLMRAGWGQLLRFARLAADDDGRFSEGSFRRVVITYPTVAPPSVRQKIQRLLRDLGIADVQTDYDEAVASAIFYVMREYSTYPELGLESFKARSRQRDKAGNPVQNVLVFDIGGGTTDVALLSLTLAEEAVFAPGEDRGEGGRYYKLTPKLLRATGHMQLGGELMTLRVFLLLKALIADRLLTLVQDGKLNCEPVRTALDNFLPEQAVNKDTKKYQAGWLRESVERENPDTRSVRLGDALKLAERVVPTRWGEGDDQRAARLQTFYALWELAETAKKQLGGKRKGVDDDAPREAFVIKTDRIKELLAPHYESLTGSGLASLEVRLTQQQVEAAISKVVEEAVRIALGALESLPKDEMVDWLILSGQSCNLVLVDREIRRRFKESNKFIWNPERVTFLPQYAKLSTSIGACYAENQRRYRLPAISTKKNLRRGTNALYFDVDNLFSYLPCSLLQQMDSGNRVEVFRAGAPLLDLYGIDAEDQQRAMTRSTWERPPLNITVYRRDYVGGVETTWCTFDGKRLAADVELTPGQWHEQIRVQYEIDHRLNVEVLAFRADAAHQKPDLALTGRESVPVDLNAALLRVAERIRERNQQKGPANAPAPPMVLPALFDADGKLGWRLGVGDGSQVRQWLFEPGQVAEFVFHPAHGPGATVRACLSKECVDAFTAEGTLVVWASLPTGKDQVSLGKIERPGDKPNFQRHYRLSLDERGALRAHPGEAAYWESDDPHCLAREPGRVLRRPTVPAKSDTDDDRNPFTGRH